MSVSSDASLAVWSFWPALLLPLATMAYLATTPHGGPAVALVLLFFVGLVVADWMSPPDRAPPAPSGDGDRLRWFLFGLAGVQAVNLSLFLEATSRRDVGALDVVMATFLVGVNSGYSAIVVAHELIHRRDAVSRLVGEALLVSVLYGHFAIEHLRGHHRRVATHADPATARFGESFVAFLPRSVAGQFASAWRLERGRVRAAARCGRRAIAGWLSAPLVVVLVAQGLVLAGLAAAFGALAVLVVALQAAIAVSCLEAANYVEHWGLSRKGRAAVVGTDSWDTGSWFSRRALFSLPRHADHHVRPGRAFLELRLEPESPKLPFGHFGTICVALVANRRLRVRLASELEARRLGPFARAGAEDVLSAHGRE